MQVLPLITLPSERSAFCAKVEMACLREDVVIHTLRIGQQQQPRCLLRHWQLYSY
jgi:hypothetical protein